MTQEQPLGMIIRDGERFALRYERHLSHPREKVWRALTESEHLRYWLPTDLVGERRAGASIELPFWADHIERYGIETPVLRGEIRAWAPPELFEWTWDADVLRWELRPADGGTLLVFTTWLSDPDRDAAWGVAAGYHACLDALVELLDTGTTSPKLIDREVGPLEERYKPLVAAPPSTP